MKAEDAKACEEARVEQDEIVRFAKVLLSLVKENEKKEWFDWLYDLIPEKCLGCKHHFYTFVDHDIKVVCELEKCVKVKE